MWRVSDTLAFALFSSTLPLAFCSSSFSDPGGSRIWCIISKDGGSIWQAVSGGRRGAAPGSSLPTPLSNLAQQTVAVFLCNLLASYFSQVTGNKEGWTGNGNQFSGALWFKVTVQDSDVLWGHKFTLQIL